jgi:hypothetical protein
MNRRYFIQSSLAAAALSKRLVAASDKVNLAFMGVRGRGKSLAQQFASMADVNILYLCDVDQNVFGPRPRWLRRRKVPNPPIGDIRRALMTRPWHRDSHARSLACAIHDSRLSGCKDVYVEAGSHNLKRVA